jgi:TPR repeat protein
LYLAGCSSTSQQTGDAKKVEETLKDSREARQQHNLGVLYSTGIGMPLDFEKSVKWFHKAAEQGLLESQFNLGIAYQGGLGVPKDIIKAYIWFTIASANGSKRAAKATAAEARDNIAQFMSQVQIQKAQRTVSEMLENNPELIQKKK